MKTDTAHMALHANLVREFPSADLAEIEKRAALVTARDYAAMLQARVRTEWAITLAAEAHEIAGELIYLPATIDNLKIATSYARNLVQASMLADHFEREGPWHG